MTWDLLLAAHSITAGWHYYTHVEKPGEWEIWLKKMGDLVKYEADAKMSVL